MYHFLSILNEYNVYGTNWLKDNVKLRLEEGISMKILINKEVFEDIQCFKRIVEYILNAKVLIGIQVNRVDGILRFDFDDVNVESLNEDQYYEILHEHLQDNLDFALEIEKGNYPDC